jgi:hypothetical protein
MTLGDGNNTIISFVKHLLLRSPGNKMFVAVDEELFSILF